MSTFLKVLLVAVYAACGVWFYQTFFSKKVVAERAAATRREQEASTRRAFEIHLEVIGERVPRVEALSGIKTFNLEDHLAALDGVEAFLISVPEGRACAPSTSRRAAS